MKMKLWKKKKYWQREKKKVRLRKEVGRTCGGMRKEKGKREILTRR